MTNASTHLDVASAEAYLLRYLAIEGVTGEEKAIAEAIRDDLIALGVPAAAIRFDDVAARIPLPTQTGNLIVDLPGTRPGPRLLFSTHLDTVPLCAGAKPRREGDRIVGDGTTDRMIEMPVKKVTSVMFGGPDLDILFVTSMAKQPLPRFPADGVQRGALFALTGLGVKGVPEPRFGG